MSSAEQVVRDFCAAASTRDPAVLRASFSHDVVYHNISMDPAEGIDATMAVIEMSGRRRADRDRGGYKDQLRPVRPGLAWALRRSPARLAAPGRGREGDGGARAPRAPAAPRP